MLHTPEGSPLPPNVSAELQGIGDRVKGKGRGRASGLLAPGRSEATLAGGPERYCHRRDGRRYLAGWLQFARLRVDLELHDRVALLIGDV